MIRSDYLRVYKGAADVPILRMKIPRPLRALHQIEITSRCNLRCKYCPSPNLGRPKTDMTPETFHRALEWVRHFQHQGTQVEVNLAGIGEPTLHPEWIEMVLATRRAVGPAFVITLTTNGITLTAEDVARIAPARPQVWVSLHRPERAAAAVRTLREAGLLAGTSTDPATNGNSWAGQVDWPESSTAAIPCMWLRHGMAMVTADGQITTCCLDASGAGAVGHLAELEPHEVKLQPYELCGDCHQVIAIEDPE